MLQMVTRGGTPWQPRFLDAINQESCIGCGRCFKVCSRKVLAPAGMTEDGEQVDFDDDEAFRKIMMVANANDCIGCTSCGKVCSTSSMQFAA